MPTDAMDQLMKAIVRAEKQYGDNHTYRHVFGALREARYAASKISTNENYESPGARTARESAANEHVPEPEDARNPNVPDTGEGSSDANSGTDG